MESLQHVVDFLGRNWALISAIVGLVVAYLRRTKFGAENAAALAVVMQIIEELNAKEVKQTVAARQMGLPEGINRQISRTVATVDPKYETPRRSIALLKKAGLVKEKQ